MGVTISSKRYSCDMGYFGFGRFRNDVAEKVNTEFHKHYASLDDVRLTLSTMTEEASKKFYKTYDAKTQDLVSQGIVSIEIANFLYQSERKGKIDRTQAGQIYSLIKDCDDNISYGYSGRKDCATMADLKKIFSDKTNVKWH